MVSFLALPLRFVLNTLILVSTLSRQVIAESSGNTSINSTSQTASNTYDYIVVGSGPGGGPLAVRLAQAGFSVLLIDAGEDHGTDLPVQIPLLQAVSAEYSPISWQFFVNHYTDQEQAQKDIKFTWQFSNGSFFVGPAPAPEGAKPLGIFYPRAGTLGGCSQHNAMITTVPSDSDWDIIANITGDASWAGSNMRQFFVKIENNQYLPNGTAGHGFNGWLNTSLTDIRLTTEDPKLLSLVLAAATSLGNNSVSSLVSTITGFGHALLSDLNSLSPDTTPGLFQVPYTVTTETRARSSPRNLLLDTANALNADGSKKFNLTIMLNTLVTRVTFDNSSTPRATGVEYLSGSHLYRADPNWANGTVTGSGQFFANKEVILSGGTFNTPQILKLSGVGPREELERFNISVVHNSPAVGTNMQDRYEVTVVAEASSKFQILENCTFLSTPSDPCFAQWQNNSDNRGVYGTNGFPFGILKRTSVADTPDADILSAGVATNFHGYFPGFSLLEDFRHYSILVLKARSRNNAGTVTLASNDPRDVPIINFNNYAVGGDEDLQASFEALQSARQIFKDVIPLDGSTFTEILPGPTIESETDVKNWIHTNAWGHHASCSVPMGPDDDMSNSVLDSKFRVKGVTGLRVVDASVFPKIPSFFLVTAVYMVSEKAAVTILEGN